MPKTHVFSQLEKIIDTRVKTNDNIISKSFSHVLTNALVFVDVLAFEHFLGLKNNARNVQDPKKMPADLEQYLKNTTNVDRWQFRYNLHQFYKY
jgi:hypothetical protein